MNLPKLFVSLTTVALIITVATACNKAEEPTTNIAQIPLATNDESTQANVDNSKETINPFDYIEFKALGISPLSKLYAVFSENAPTELTDILMTDDTFNVSNGNRYAKAEYGAFYKGSEMILQAGNGDVITYKLNSSAVSALSRKYNVAETEMQFEVECNMSYFAPKDDYNELDTIAEQYAKEKAPDCELTINSQYHRQYISANGNSDRYIPSDIYYFDVVNKETQEKSIIEVAMLGAVKTQDEIITQKGDGSLYYTGTSVKIYTEFDFETEYENCLVGSSITKNDYEITRIK